MVAVILVIAAATVLLASPGMLDGWFGGSSGDANAAGTATETSPVTTAESAAPSTSVATVTSVPETTMPAQPELTVPDGLAPSGSSVPNRDEMLVPGVSVVPEQLDLPSDLSGLSGFSDRRIDMVGDSLLLSARHEIREVYDDVDDLDIDAVEGRPLAGGQSALRRIGDNDPDIVVIALGTNDLDPGDGYDELIEQSLDLTSDAECVVWVDLQEFKPGLGRINRLIRAARPTAIAPWSTIAGPSELHTSDGYHLSPEGQAAFADVIADTLAEEC
jgi:lysophospholipase L1-like esterase